MENKELTEKELEMAKQFEQQEKVTTIAVKTDNVPTTESDSKSSTSIINNQQQVDLTEIEQDETFRKASKDLNYKAVHTELTERALVIANKELNNQYEQFQLEQKKELLKSRVKAEKKLIKEQCKAEKYSKKKKIREDRFGYLYKTEEIEILDDKGELIKKTVYKDFTPSYFINRVKEFERWYNNLTASLQNIIFKTFKFFMSLGAIGIIIAIIYGIIIWLKNSGILAI